MSAATSAVPEEEITIDAATANIGPALGTDKNNLSRSSLLSKSGHPLDVSRHISSHDKKKAMIQEEELGDIDDLAMEDSFAVVEDDTRIVTLLGSSEDDSDPKGEGGSSTSKD